MKKNRKGFTLVELLAVIVIISILVGLVVSSVSRYKNKAEEKEKKILRQNIISIFNNYRIEMLEEGKVIKPGVKYKYKISNMDSDAIINYNGKKCTFGNSYIFYTKKKKESSNEEVYCILFTCNGEIIIDDIGDTENTDCKK